MPETQASLLHSAFLRDVKARFALGRPGRIGALQEFREECDSSLMAESLETLLHVSRGHELFVYQTLTIWGDQIAMYTVRENVQKRLYKVIHQVGEFALLASPQDIVNTFWRAGDDLQALRVPPGDTEADRVLLRAIEARWHDLSVGNSH